MNEWLAFGVVAVICVVLVLLVRFAESEKPPTSDDSSPEGPA